jgi:positive regulator of sigma E activity
MSNIINNLERQNTCNSCLANSSCGVGLVSKLFNKRVNIKTLPIRENEFVLNAFLLYLVPIIFLIFGAILADSLYPQNTILNVLFALGFFVLGTTLLFVKKLF